MPWLQSLFTDTHTHTATPTHTHPPPLAPRSSYLRCRAIHDRLLRTSALAHWAALATSQRLARLSQAAGISFHAKSCQLRCFAAWKHLLLKRKMLDDRMRAPATVTIANATIPTTATAGVTRGVARGTTTTTTTAVIARGRAGTVVDKGATIADPSGGPLPRLGDAIGRGLGRVAGRFEAARVQVRGHSCGGERAGVQVRGCCRGGWEHTRILRGSLHVYTSAHIVAPLINPTPC